MNRDASGPWCGRSPMSALGMAQEYPWADPELGNTPTKWYARPTSMTLWRCLLLVYPRIEVRVPTRLGFSKQFVHELPRLEVEEAVESFHGFPALVSDLTHGQAGVEKDIVIIERALSTLTELGKGTWWPSPTDTRMEMELHEVKTKYDSVFVFWPQNNLQNGTSIKSGGWGLGMGASDWSMGATYATVANIQSAAWQIPLQGEVWLHEWLHGVCAHFAKQGHQMPDGDADGADRHGYMRSPTTGWTDYYRDLMTCNVSEGGKKLGIPLEAWRASLD